MSMKELAQVLIRHFSNSTFIQVIKVLFFCLTDVEEVLSWLKPDLQSNHNTKLL